VAADLSPPLGQQPLVPGVHLRLQALQHLDGFDDGRSDERVRAAAPDAELDQFAVDQYQRAVQRQGGVRDDQIERHRLARTGFPVDGQVPLGGGDVDRLAGLVHAEEHRVEDG
jgi:hypothetical protein